jgi:hypothetical protein
MTAPRIHRLSAGLLLLVLNHIGPQLQAETAPTRSLTETSSEEWRDLATHRLLEASRRVAAQGWQAREGVWSARSEPHNARLITLHLQHGLEYLFLIAHRPTRSTAAVQLLDSQGRPVPGTDTAFKESGFQAISITPGSSGRFYLYVRTPGIAPAAEIVVSSLYR